MAVAADLRRVHFFQMGNREEPVPFRIPQDVEELSRRIRETNAALVVVDPLIEFIDGKTDAHKSQPVRQALAALNALARESTVAIVVIIHLNKGASTDPLIRHEGSAAFTQVLRGAMLLGPDPNDPDGERGSRRVLAVSSSNLAQLAPSLLYEIRTATVRGDTGEDIVTADITCVGESDATGSDLLGMAGDDASEPLRARRGCSVPHRRAVRGPKPASKMKKSAGEVGSLRRPSGGRRKPRNQRLQDGLAGRLGVVSAREMKVLMRELSTLRIRSDEHLCENPADTADSGAIASPRCSLSRE